MIRHSEMGDAELRRQIRRGEVLAAGNARLRIYGTLNCKSGKRMKRETRVFFRSVGEAIANGFRPCGHCLKADYANWKR